MRPIITFGLIALVLHWSWETGHAVAYVETDVPFLQRVWHCFPMAVLDTGWSGSIVLLAVVLARILGRRMWAWFIAAAIGALTAIAVERFALETGRWSYNEWMPIIPAIDVGLWPVAQMTILPLLTLYVATKISRKAQTY